MLSKHEALALILRKKTVVIRDLVEVGENSYSACQQMLQRLHTSGDVRVVGWGNREKVFELTERGIQKLEYFEANGCNNVDCTCKFAIPELKGVR